MRWRYGLILALLIAVGLGAFKLSTVLATLRTQPQQVQNVDPAAVAKVQQMPMPTSDAEIAVVEKNLSELRQSDLLSAVTQYSRQRWLTKILGIEADSIETVGAAKDWQTAHPDQDRQLQQRILREAIDVRLASPSISPPQAGRLGNNWNAVFNDVGDGLWQQTPNGNAVNNYAFVVEVANRARLPLHDFEFELVPVDGAAQSVSPPLPPRSYTWCGEFGVGGTGKTLNPGDTLTMMCEIRVAGIEPASLNALHQMINEFRSRGVTAWVKQLEIRLPESPLFSDLQLHDHGVDAEFGHPPSGNVDAAYVVGDDHHQAAPSLPVKLTSCHDRGDCFKTWLQPFAGQIDIVWALVTVMLPGYLVAGLARGIGSNPRAPAVLVFVLAAIILVPYAFHSLGSGYGVVIATILTAFGTVGYWLGFAIGLWTSLPRSEE